MPVSVTLPALGESVQEGTITRWLKQEGERVELDEPLLEVSTDKVDTEIPSPAAGILVSIKAQEDDTVDVGAELAVIDDGTGAAAPAAAPAQEAPAAPAEPAQAAPAAPAAPAAQEPAPAPAAAPAA
ncbi:biotin/lipoyl-containing protein, partial [Embleya sp. NPDC005575]|uniref:biotin/lipoyl-containing protein n=1 Tax=Embleya sp. NPDC005575 TaxID=3156892 RepID=UPI0033A28FA2